MGAEILVLPGMKGPASRIAHYLRVGDSGHVQLEALLAEGRFPAEQVVVDASRFGRQKSLIKALKTAGIRIILETQAAELAELGKFSGYAKDAPWSLAEDRKILGPDHYSALHPNDVIGQIARFAIENQVDAVLAPCHLLRNDSADPWFRIDRLSCERLRQLLDNEGGSHIGIDYTLIIQHTHLRDEATRGALIPELASLPFENLWIRASGFGADATPPGARHYINSLSGFHNLGKPVIADHLGGLIGLAAVAFGAASGVAHGVGERERFDAGSWDKQPKKREKGTSTGRATRLHIAGLDKSLTVPELKALAGARGGHRLVVCQDRNCCLHGLDDMLKNWKGHNLNQQFGSVAALEKIPDTKRAEHFLANDMAFTDRQARQIKELRPVIDRLKPRKEQTAAEAGVKLMALLNKHARRDEKLRAVLENLHFVKGENAPRALPVVLTGSPNRKSVKEGEEI